MSKQDKILKSAIWIAIILVSVVWLGLVVVIGYKILGL